MLEDGVRPCGDVLQNLEQEAPPRKTPSSSQVQGHTSRGGPTCLAGVCEDGDGLGVVVSGRRHVDQGAFQAYARQRPRRLHDCSQAGDPVDLHALDLLHTSVLVDRDMDGGWADGRRLGSEPKEDQG
jgi:hypothetical protein